MNSFGQKWREIGVFEVGPMLHYQHTSFFADNAILGKKEAGSSFSGFDPNYAVGVYGIYYWKPKVGVGAELYYDRVSAAQLPAEDHYNSLTFLPYINYDPFKFLRNFYFGAGIGVAFIQEEPDYGTRVRQEDIRVITVPMKLSASYRIRNQVTFELGANVELMEVVASRVRRNAVFFGMKIPLNRVFGGYRF